MKRDIAIGMVFFLIIGSGTIANARDRMIFDHVFDLGVPGGQTCLQDNDGFLWIGTDGGGMFRYDGYGLRHFGTGPGLLSNGNVWRILEDQENPDVFWIGTSGGLNRFDKATETFAYFKHDPEKAGSLGNNTVQDIVQDSGDPTVLWLGTSGGGLNKFDKKTETVVRYEHDSANPQTIAFNDVWRIIQDRETPNIFWVGTYGGGLDRFDKTTGIFAHFVHDPENPNSLGSEGNNVDAIIQDRNDPAILWIGTPKNGMDRFDKRTGTFTNYPAGKTNGEVALIHDDGSGRLWLGGYVMNNGLTLFDKKTGTFANHKNDPNDPASLGNDLVVNVYEDRSGIFWITTYSGKVDKIDKNKSDFRTYRHNSDEPGSLSNSAVTCIYEDRVGTVWLGTQGGLNRFDPETRAFSRFIHDPDDPDSLDVDYVLGMYDDSSGDFWLSLYVGPLVRFDRESGKVVGRYATEAESVTKIVGDPNDPDILWMGTHMAGFASFDKRSETFSFYKPNPDRPNTGPNNTYIQEVVHDTEENVIWMGGCFGGGLSRFDKNTKTFAHYVSAPNDARTISADAIAAIRQDSSGTLWIGTKGGGLNRFDKQRGIFTRYSKKQGVPSEVNGICEDENGWLWLSSNEGIVRFNPTSGQVDKQYVRHDGLQGDAFLFGSALNAKNGEFWFGGTNGVNRFDPAKLAHNANKPPVALTSLTQAGETVDWDGSGRVPSRLSEIKLDWRRNFFEFEFAALSFTIPEKNRCQYKLEGFDRDWYDSGTRRFGRYSNLPGGTYTLRIIGANNDGVWNKEGVSLTVRVIPPFWKTRWFMILASLLVLGIVFGTYFIRVRVIRKQKERLEFQVKIRTRELEEAREKAGAASEAKSVFLANMSHELRSPLTVILGFAQLVSRNRDLPETHREYLDIIRSSGNHLLTLINQVLNLSKIEAGQTTLENVDFDLYEMLNDVHGMFKIKAEKRELRFLFEQDADLPRYVRADDVKLRQVLINLLSNAIKFTDKGGVTMRAGKETGNDRPGNLLRFEVEDTGPGIATDELDTLFEAFSQTETGRRKQEGTGLGLPISRNFVRLMGGDITVESDPGRKTTFSFSIYYEPATMMGDVESPIEKLAIALEPGQPAYRILIVDDKPDNRQLLLGVLGPLGFDIREASDGREAVDIWDEWKPHLIWMDIRMPIMDGCEAAREIRKRESGSQSRTPIIALTASVLEEDRNEVLSAGCDGFVRKPFRESDILDMLAKHIGARFVYEDRIEHANAEDETAAQEGESFPELPPDFLENLEEAARGGDVEMIHGLIEGIRSENPLVAEKLAKLANDFEYENIFSWIREARK